MTKDYFFFNEEPNTNILGLDPIILAFTSSKFKKFTGKNLSILIYELDRGKFRVAAKKNEWSVLARHLFERIEREPEFEKAIVLNIRERADKIYQLSLETLKRLKDNKISVRERVKIIKKIFLLFTDICIYGLVGPIIEIENAAVTKKLEIIFKNRVKEIDKRNEYLNLLTASFEENFDQKGQKNLIKVAQKIYENRLLKNLFLKNNKKIVLELPEKIKEEIKEYVFKWGWLTYGYCGPEYKLDNALDDIRGILSLKISPQEQANKLDKELKIGRDKQKKVLKELKFSKKESYMIQVARDFMETKYLRSKMMFLADFTINRLLEFFLKKETINIKQIGVCTAREIIKYFDTGKLLPRHILDERLRYCLLFSKEKSERILQGEEARSWIKKNVWIEEVDKGLKELSGQVACVGEGGIVRGVVKIVNTVKDAKKFKEGDILVSICTTPNLVSIMKKAGAIITDIGGLTSHAAIVSRELKVPCVIGTKIATKALKDGNVVEVDINKGIVKIL